MHKSLYIKVSILESNTLNILIIDDHPLMIQGIKGLVGSIMGQVTFDVSQDIHQGIQLISGRRYDVITLDINLAGDDSIQYLPTVKQLAGATPIVVYTSYATPSLVRKAIKLGANGYLLKTDGLQEVEAGLKSVLNGETYVSSDLQQSRKKSVDKVAKHTITSEFVQRYGFSKREMEILSFLAKGLDDKSIADKVFLSHHTVHEHRKRIYKKLRVHSKYELMELFA